MSRGKVQTLAGMAFFGYFLHSFVQGGVIASLSNALLGAFSTKKVFVQTWMLLLANAHVYQMLAILKEIVEDCWHHAYK